MRLREPFRAHAIGALAFFSSGSLSGAAAASEPSDTLPSETAATPPATRGAKDHYLRGVEFAQHAAWDAALAEFNASLALRRTSAASMNAAYCLRALGRMASALQLYQGVLRDFQTALTESERGSVRSAISELELSVGHLSVRANVAEALILVDGEARGKTPVVDLLLNPGLHLVRIMKPGYEPLQVSLTIAATETTSWSPQLLRLEEEPRQTSAGLGPRVPAAEPTPRAKRFSLELTAGPALYRSLGGGVDASCGSDVVIAGRSQASCPDKSSLSAGVLLSARAGYRLQARTTLELAVGYLRLWHDVSRRMRVTDANGQAYDSVPSAAGGSGNASSATQAGILDQTRVSMPFAGIGASREFLQRTPVLLRLTTGIGRASVSTALNGSFVAESSSPASSAGSGELPSAFRIGVLEDPRPLWVPFIAPEARFGYRLASGWVFDLGVAVWLLWAPSYLRTSSAVGGTPPEERWVLHADGSGDPVKLGFETALGAALFVVPSLAVRHDL